MASTQMLRQLQAIKETFEKLPDRLGDRVVIAALRAAAQPIRQEAQNLVPMLEESSKFRHRATVRKNITVRKSKEEKYGVFIGVIPYSRSAIKQFKKSQKAKGLTATAKDIKGFRKSQANQISPDDPFYWWWLEFGTKNMKAANGGRGFMRMAFERKKQEALKRFETYMQTRVTKEAEKLAREMGAK